MQINPTQPMLHSASGDLLEPIAFAPADASNKQVKLPHAEGTVSSTGATADDDETWNLLLWDMLADNDLSGAYWLTHSLAARGQSTPVSDWLIASIYGAQFVSGDTPSLARSLLEIVQTHEIDTTRHKNLELLTLAAAMRPALVAPSSGLIGWVNAPVMCPALRDLAQAIHDFAAFGLSLQREDILGVADEAERKKTIAEASREARRWLDDAPSRKKRANVVWRSLVGPKGKLREFLQPVCDNRSEKLAAVRSSLEYWQDRHEVDTCFDELNRQASQGRPERLTNSNTKICIARLRKLPN
ncbi:MAG: hypothetical protein IPK16_10025 [Anaerolineales bacterium]|nr:hypothetical protein [Anaerolineales bacterium]